MASAARLHGNPATASGNAAASVRLQPDGRQMTVRAETAGLFLPGIRKEAAAGRAADTGILSTGRMHVRTGKLLPYMKPASNRTAKRKSIS